MNYYYDLPLELQNYIESFLIIKPKDNELLNNEEEIEKQYNLYKTNYNYFNNYIKSIELDKIHDFHTHRIAYDYWDNYINACESYNKYLDKDYTDIKDCLNKFQENFTKFITYQELYFKIKALKKIKKLELKIQQIEECKNEAKKKHITHNLKKIQDDSFDTILKKYMTELFTDYDKCSSFDDKKQQQIKYCFDNFKKYRVLNTTYDGTDYYTYKIPLKEEFINDIELFKNYIKNTYFKVGKYYNIDNYELQITNITKVMGCFRIIFFKNSSIHNQLITRKIFIDENEVEYIKLTDKINVFANELNKYILV